MRELGDNYLPRGLKGKSRNYGFQRTPYISVVQAYIIMLTSKPVCTSGCFRLGQVKMASLYTLLCS